MRDIRHDLVSDYVRMEASEVAYHVFRGCVNRMIRFATRAVHEYARVFPSASAKLYMMFIESKHVRCNLRERTLLFRLFY